MTLGASTAAGGTIAAAKSRTSGPRLRGSATSRPPPPPLPPTSAAAAAASRLSFTQRALEAGAPVAARGAPVTATAAALARLGDGIVDVKRAFDSRAAPIARGGERAIPSDDATLTATLTDVGIMDVDAAFIEELRKGAAADALPDAYGAPLPFAPFLRFCAAAMDAASA
jgi:hypothetical protein